MNGVMDEHEMTSGVIPLRHASLPGHVKLPRRYEKAAMGSNGIPVRVRKISIQPGQSVLGDSLSDRLDDLMAAILWVKQELIMLRQHDILLKRQFIDIQHSIQTLQKPKPPRPSPSSPSTTTFTTTTTAVTHKTPTSPTSPTTTIPNTTTTTTTITTTTTTAAVNHKTPTSPTSPTTTIPNTTTINNNNITTTNNNNHLSEPLLNGDAHLGEEEEEEEVNHAVKGRVKQVGRLMDEDSFMLETFVVRPASSVTLLKEDSEEEDEELDTFCEDFYFRPRTSSMRTSRDMAALARRRGSKELI